MDLSSVVDELYGVPPHEFTAARNQRSSEALQAGDKDLATSIKQLRKPTVAAWMANMLARDQSSLVEQLIGLGDALRSTGTLDGDQIRQVSKEKNDTVTKLIRQARSLAKRAGQSVSQAAELDLEATLDASFAEPASAVSLREGRLTDALHYSGLGLGPGSVPRAAAPTRKGSGEANPTLERNARRTLQEAIREAEVADAEVEKARRAVTVAEADLKRLKAALTAAVRRSARAHEKRSKAEKKLGSRS